ncbi:MAG TPA: DUF444 family protein [Candidatus Saccharimonadales bacterium]|nr:DUF444 family protein [Candidatus Saccharimonadales bacterium]
MALRIEQDHNRFKKIVRGRIRKNLKGYIGRGELIGRKGRELVSIPIPQIDLPHFTYGPRQSGGVGQGKGDVGQPIGSGEPEEGEGQAGNAPGEHILEVEVTLEELAQILGEELELPSIRQKGRKNIVSEKDRYVGISSSGPESLRHFKRTYKEALKRQIASGTYDPLSPRVVPIRRDRRYRTWKVHSQPESNAVIIYMMDVSGSMGEEQKEIVRIESFWIDTWLRSQYDGIEVRYIIHDAEAREVDRETFYHTRESGGTVISSAYRLAEHLVQTEFRPEEWNIYLFHFSDGDNWSQGDTEECIRLLHANLLPASNLFCYGQVESPYGTGQFLQDLKDALGSDERVALSQIENKEAIYGSIREFLGRGR